MTKALSGVGAGTLHWRVTLAAGLAFASNGLTLAILSYAIAALIVVVIGEETAGRSLEEITDTVAPEVAASP